jgi:Domain of unknown function (DUF4328)/Protein of unknown function (DUF2510)
MCTVAAVADEWAPQATLQPSSDWWRPTRGLTTALVVALMVQAACSIGLAVVDDGTAWVRLHDALRNGFDQADSQRLSHALDGIQPWNSVFGWASVVVLVLAIVWTYRSTANARAAGRVGARWTPGWTIAGWLVPVLNLVVPYQAWSDLWRSSEPDSAPGDGWRRRPASSLVIGWWFFQLGGQLVLSAVIVAATLGDLDATDARPVLVVGHLALAAGALLAVVVTRGISERQSARQEQDPAPTQRPLAHAPAAPTTADGPGWYPDPSRRFDHRYWDGSTWTEHVSRGGVAGTAPVVPADWYPDPTGRFHWRYWTGREWTEHVSRDQELFIDPLPDDG